MREIQETFLSKNGIAAQKIARALLLVKNGDRIPTTLEYVRKFGMGSGTIQRAMADLTALGAVELRARGHQGTFLVEKDVVKLWAASGLGTCVGSMPLPSSRQFQGLASGLRQAFEMAGIPFSMVYCHGADLRLKALLEKRIDFMVASRRYVDSVAAREGDSLSVAMDFGEGSYYAKDSVVVVTRSGIDTLNEVRRVGIDRSSGDHRELTEVEFPGHEMVGVFYVDIPQAIVEGEIDGAVWHRTALSIPLEQAGLKVYELQNPETRRLAREMSRAAVITLADSPARAVISEMDRDQILATQNKVIDRELRPVY